MKTFKEFLDRSLKNKLMQEMALASKGDFPISYSRTEITETVMMLKYKKIKSVSLSDSQEYEIWSYPSVNKYVLGKWGVSKKTSEVCFASYAEIDLRKETLLGKVYDAIELVRVSPDVFGRGIGTKMYLALVKDEKLNIISDTEQYFGARKLWARLSKTPTVRVDLLDTNTGQTQKNAKLNHGSKDFEFDKRVWGYMEDECIAQNMRMILKDIK